MHALKLLLVEDHQMTLMGLQMLLSREPDFEVAGQAADAAEAVRLADELRPDVVLMDIGLPEMDGIEATQAIKAAHPATKVLMLTSKESERDVFAALAAGADAYCLKGTDAQKLATAVRAVHEGTAWLDPGIARLVLGHFQRQSQAPLLSPATAPAKSVAVADCPLTAREMEVLKLIVDGMSNHEIADTLVITKATAKAHVHSILQKLCVDDRTQAAVLAMRQGYV